MFRILEVVVADEKHLEFINSELFRVDTTHFVNDDYSRTVNFKITTPSNILIVLENGRPTGFFLFVQRSRIVVDVHICIRSCTDKKSAAELVFPILRQHGVLIITAHIPKFNFAVRKFAKSCGFMDVGILEKSFLSKTKLHDQYIMCKPL